MNILENFTNEFIQLIEKDSLGNIVEYLSQYETNDERYIYSILHLSFIFSVKDENDDKNEDEKKVLLMFKPFYDSFLLIISQKFNQLFGSRLAILQS